MSGARPLSLEIAVWAASCATALLFWIAFTEANESWKESQEKSRRLLIETDRLANCCFDTTTVSLTMRTTYDIPPGPRVQIRKSVRKRQPGEVFVKLDTAVLSLQDTAVWIEMPSGVNMRHLSTTARYMRFRIENNP